MKKIPFDIRYLYDNNVKFFTQEGYPVSNLRYYTDRFKYRLLGNINGVRIGTWTIKGIADTGFKDDLIIQINENNSI